MNKLIKNIHKLQYCLKFRWIFDALELKFSIIYFQRCVYVYITLDEKYYNLTQNSWNLIAHFWHLLKSNLLATNGNLYERLYAKITKSNVQKKDFTNGRVYVVDNFYSKKIHKTKKGDAPAGKAATIFLDETLPRNINKKIPLPSPTTSRSPILKNK